MHRQTLLPLFILLTLLHGGYALRFILLSDTELTAEDTYIEKELLPILEDINFDYLLIAGGLLENPTSSDLTSELSSLLFQKFQVLGKKIFWVPSQEEIGAPPNVTNFDENIHKKVVQPNPGLYIVGYGGTYSAAEIQSFYQNYTFSGSNPPSVIFLTYQGPAGNGFDTTKIWVNSVDEETTGIYNLTDFLISIQTDAILYLHGDNPQGIGSSAFGQMRILNPGGAKEYQSFSIFDLVLNGKNMWVLSDWKFYRYGNVTISSGGPTNVETCKQVTKTVAAPWQPSPETVAALVLLSLFLVVYIIGFGVFVNVGKAE